MNYGEKLYIWQADDWPNWRYDLSALTWPLTEVSRAQGVLLGRLADLGPALRDQASLAALTEDVVKTSEIEGEVLSVESVRSSIARRRAQHRLRAGGLKCIDGRARIAAARTQVMHLPAEDFFDAEADDFTVDQFVERNAEPLAFLILLKPGGGLSALKRKSKESDDGKKTR